MLFRDKKPCRKKIMAMDIIRLLESQAEALKACGVERIGVFGSFPRGEATTDSDVDIYVVFNDEQRTFKNFNTIYELLESLFNRRIDLVTDQSLNERKAKIILPTVRYASLGN